VNAIIILNCYDLSQNTWSLGALTRGADLSDSVLMGVFTGKVTRVLIYCTYLQRRHEGESSTSSPAMLQGTEGSHLS
jgi:hypothetical protein